MRRYPKTALGVLHPKCRAPINLQLNLTPMYFPLNNSPIVFNHPQEKRRQKIRNRKQITYSAFFIPSSFFPIFYLANSCSIAAINSGDSGPTLLRNLATTSPCLLTKNFSKFQETSPLGATELVS